MLRKAIIFRVDNDKEEQIFEHTFARSFDPEQYATVLARLKGFFLSPLEGKPTNKPFFNYQVHYLCSKSIYFIFITDNSDRPKAIAKELESTARMYHKLFQDPKNPNLNPEKIEEFKQFLQETHTLLHPKIALIGPIGAGKTTICHSFDIEVEPTKIMNFGEVYQVKIQGLYFDLWDYVLNDDFSPLSSKVATGADLILVVINAADLNDKKDLYFINTAKREEKFSRIGYLITHTDLPNAKLPEEIKAMYKIENNVHVITPIEESAAVSMESIISEILDLKLPLPAEFRLFLIGANNAVEKEDYKTAIELLTKAIDLCKEYQDTTHVPMLEEKIKELTIKQKEQKEREEREKSKITAPTMRQFGGKVTVASLKGTTKKVEASGIITAQPKPTPIQAPNSSPNSDFSPMPTMPTTPPPMTKSTPFPASNQTLSSMPTKPESSQINSTIDTTAKSSNPFFSQSSIPTIGVPQKQEEEIPKMSAANPFFSQSALPGGNVPKFVELKKENEMGTLPPEQSDEELDIEKELEPIKVKPLDLTKFEATKAKNFEEENAQIIKSGITMNRTLSMEQSPLRKEEVLVKPQIEKSQDSKTKLAVPEILQAFDPLKNKMKKEVVSNKTMEFAEKIFNMIKDEGEFLPLAQCKTYIEMLQTKLGKTNLTEEEIKKAADLFVKKKREK
jgi:signal recognition particle receptor subunit beta